jgi:hypothetical protein
MRSILEVTFWDVQRSRLRRALSGHLSCIKTCLSLAICGRPIAGPFQVSSILKVASDRRRTKAVATIVCPDSSMLGPPVRSQLVSAGMNVRFVFSPKIRIYTELQSDTPKKTTRRQDMHRKGASPREPNRSRNRCLGAGRLDEVDRATGI